MRNRCIVCGGELVKEPLYIIRNMPSVSQNLPTAENVDKDKTIDLRLCQCSKCGLVQFDCEPVDYYKASTRAAERSEGLINLRREDYKHLIETYNLQGKKILEVGAGKGGFLQTLKEMTEYDIKEYGMEYNKEYVEIAKKAGVNVFYGDAECADRDLPEAPYDAFVSFAYPARLVNPNAMLELMNRNLSEGGIGYVMVPSLEHLLRNEGFFDIVRDHMAYYNKQTLKFLFEKNNFDVLECGEKGKCYLYVVVRKRKVLNIKQYWEYVDDFIDNVRNFVIRENNDGKKIAVWCAGHFAFTVLSITGIAGYISYIIDNAEFKQGHFAPGSKIPIKSAKHFKKEPVDEIMILGPIYIDEIVKEIKEKCSDKLRIITVDKKGIKIIEE